MGSSFGSRGSMGGVEGERAAGSNYSISRKNSSSFGNSVGRDSAIYATKLQGRSFPKSSLGFVSH